MHFGGASLNGVLRLTDSFGSNAKGSMLYITGTPASLPYYLSFNAAASGAAPAASTRFRVFSIITRSNSESRWSDHTTSTIPAA